jgi:hypothetical protein
MCPQHEQKNLLTKLSVTAGLAHYDVSGTHKLWRLYALRRGALAGLPLWP